MNPRDFSSVPSEQDVAHRITPQKQEVSLTGEEVAAQSTTPAPVSKDTPLSQDGYPGDDLGFDEIDPW